MKGKNPKDMFKAPIQPRRKVIASSMFNNTEVSLRQGVNRSIFISKRLNQIDHNTLNRNTTE